MLAILEGHDEVLICEVVDGQPILANHFAEDTGRDREDYSCRLVEPPIVVTPGRPDVDEEKRL